MRRTSPMGWCRQTGNSSDRVIRIFSSGRGMPHPVDRAVLCLDSLENTMEVVKPHGRLGPLRSEVLADVPRAAYRRDSLSRPFRELKAPGGFILGGASHLDAFSGYLRLPSLPGVAAGATAGTRAGSSTRSSRTRVHAPQSSNAHSGYRPNCLTTF